MSDHRPTEEQAAAIALYSGGENLVVEAYAGGGKTSLAVMMAQAEPNRIGQYCAFNKSIVQDSAKKLPGNVHASTLHSLAYRAVGHQFSHRLNAPRQKSSETARLLRMEPMFVPVDGRTKVIQPSYLAGLVMRAIDNFCHSIDPEPGTQHVPYVDGIDVPTADGKRTYDNNRAVRDHLYPYLGRAWADLTSVTGQLRYGHDCYQRLWEMSGPRILADVIFIDEAQDLDAVQRSILLGQTDSQLVVIGDSFQQLYEFRGSHDSIAQMKAEGVNTAVLSQTFRFGDAIADVANAILDRLGAKIPLRGLPSVMSMVVPVAEPDAIMCRTNAQAVMTVLEMQEKDRRACLIGGAKDVLAFAKAAAELQQGRPCFHQELACFDSWGEVLAYVASDPLGSELALMVRLIDRFGTGPIIAALGESTTEDRADVVVGTVHAVKGREWDTVKIAPDFAPAKEGDLSAAEWRVAYVAVTRAQRELDITSVPHFLDASQTFPLAGTLAAPPEPSISAACPDCGRLDVVRDSGIIGAHVCSGVMR